MANIVLVHGSCHGGWCWKKVTPFLRNNGNVVYTPTLTGLGERTHLASKDIGLDTHILDIVQEFEYEDLDEVILVGHSYGGMVVGGVADKVPKRIKRLVYLDGYIPQDKKSAFDIIPGLEEIYKERALKELGKEWLVAPYEPQVWGVTDPPDIRWVKPRLSPMPWHTHDQHASLTNPEAINIPKTYISCTEYDNFHFMAQRAKSAGWDYHELKTGHDAMITAPKELAGLIESICESN
ncbi:MAG: alpha/beta fold hydrolase [Candidatus Nitrosocosmicus sp.]|nr:alpha/beta fold hydrolase [Candidatus Nitrosocosmicus sp.]